MKHPLFAMHAFRLPLMLLCVAACDPRPKTTSSRDSGSEKPQAPSGQATLVRTQGSNPSDNVRCALQDRAGNLWFGTTGEGIYRYDGRSFTHFTARDGLNSNFVWSLLEDKAGRIWFGTADGIARYDGKTIAPVPLPIDNDPHPAASSTNDQAPRPTNEVFSIMQDKSGLLWFGTTAGVYRYDGQSFSRFMDDKRIVNESALSLTSVQCMLQDRAGRVWFGSGPHAFEGICLYDGTTLTHFKPKNEGWIRNMLEDKNGTIWFGTRHYGTWRYDGTRLTPFAGKEGIGSPMLEDRAGNLWFGGEEKLSSVESEGGIWRYDGKAFTNFTTRDGLSKYFVWSMTEDRAGNIWIGTRNNGLSLYDGKSFTSFSE